MMGSVGDSEGQRSADNQDDSEDEMDGNTQVRCAKHHTVIYSL